MIAVGASLALTAGGAVICAAKGRWLDAAFLVAASVILFGMLRARWRDR